MTLPDINEVLRRHDVELMAIPGVVGVAIGLLADRHTSCFRVLVVKRTRDLRRKLPKQIEGHPVVVEESGIIRALPKSQPASAWTDWPSSVLLFFHAQNGGECSAF